MSAFPAVRPAFALSFQDLPDLNRGFVRPSAVDALLQLFNFRFQLPFLPCFSGFQEKAFGCIGAAFSCKLLVFSSFLHGSLACFRLSRFLKCAAWRSGLGRRQPLAVQRPRVPKLPLFIDSDDQEVVGGC
jgi:hypothetical protein